MDNVYRGLTSWHRETLSAWSMIGVIIGAIVTFAMGLPSIPTFLIMTQAIAHAPFSIAYHCNHNKVVNNDDIRYIKNDVAMIFVGQLIMHVALSMRSVPWQVSVIVTAVVGCCCAHVADTIWNHPPCGYQDIKDIGISHAWIFVLHYIPIMFKGVPKVTALHFVFFLCILSMYRYSILGSLAGTRESLNLDNAVMHCCLILNNIFAHHYASI